MAFLHTHSCECLKSELFLFEISPTQTTIENSHCVQYKPISSLTDDSLIEFVQSTMKWSYGMSMRLLSIFVKPCARDYLLRVGVGRSLHGTEAIHKSCKKTPKKSHESENFLCRYTRHGAERLYTKVIKYTIKTP